MPDEMNNKNPVERAVSEAVSAIAKAAQEAAHVIACAASEALKVKNAEDKNDHDLIIKLDGKVDGLRTDIQELKSGTAGRIDALEKEKNNKADSYIALFKKGVDKNIADIEADIVALKLSRSNQNVLVGIGIAILSLLSGLMIYHIAK